MNRPQWFKYYITTVICIAMMMCNFLAAGPAMAIVSTTLDFFPCANPAVDPQEFSTAGGNVSYFFMATALMQGLGNFFWIPLTNKYGRRPAYLASYTIDTASAIWLCFKKKNIQGLCSWSNCYGLALVPLRPSVR